MSTITKYVIAILVGASLSYILMPRKIETKIVEVEKRQTDTEREKHKTTTTTERVLPDGTKETKTVITEDTNTQKKTTTDKTLDSTTTKTYGGASSSVNLLAATSFKAGEPTDYGVGVDRQVLGPLKVGAFFFKSGMVGLSLGVQF